LNSLRQIKIWLLSNRAWRLAVAAVALIVIMAAVATVAYQVWQSTLAPLNRLRLNGQDYFLAGVNYPYKSTQDFGTGTWGHSGISDPTTYAEVDTDFTNMQAAGIKVVKWRIFNDGRYSPEFDQNGFATGLDDKFFPDLDAALEIAQKHDIYLILSLFSSGIWTTSCTQSGVHFGYGSELMSDPARRQALIDKGLVPTLKHLEGNDRVVAYEIIAEPEWGIRELQEPDYRQKVSLADVKAFVKDVVAAIHQYSGAKVTLESNRPANMKNWTDVGLDFYTTSWYDWMEPYEPLDRDATVYGLNKPVVLGELPATAGQYYSLSQMLTIAYGRGYGGVFPWSFGAGDKYSQWGVAKPLWVSWLRAHWSGIAVGLLSGPMPDPNAPETPPPYSWYPAKLSMEKDTVTVGVDLQVRDGGQFSIQALLYRGSDTQPLQHQEMLGTFQKDGRRVFSMTFNNLVPGQRYQISVGIYDQSDKLLKWINAYTNLIVQNGQVAIAPLSQQAAENPCTTE
jgi:hypothetical protein